MFENLSFNKLIEKRKQKKANDALIRPDHKIDVYLEQNKEKQQQPFLIDPQINSSDKDVLIELKNIVKTFGQGKKKAIAVDDISFKIYKNQNIAFLGANGAGKTTTVEIVAGINKPTSGKILYKYDYKDSFHEGIGIQFQDSSYPVGLHVKDVILFMINVYKVDITKAELNDMVTAFGLDKFYNRPARSLSGGQQQRLNILLALMHKPKVVFLDELSTGLDISVREQIVGFVKRYCAKYEITIILVSHNMEEVQLICDRVIIMQKGKIKVDLYKKEIIDKYKTIETLAQKYI